MTHSELAQRILDALPQTQCQRCGYPDCASYANAIATGQAAINQCPPGGMAGISRLAAITGQPVQALNPEFGQEQERTMAFIDEDWCIGCTLCIQACPVDAIIGSNKVMHTIDEAHCTGCELCVPACPVDCIEIEITTPGHTAWEAWSPSQADQARQRYADHQARQQQQLPQTPSAADAPSTTGHSKQSTIAAALAKARAQRSA